MMRRASRAALRIALLYALFGALWILFSDRVLEWSSPDVAQLSWIQTLKGWFYVALTAWLLYLLIQRSVGRITSLSYHSRLTGLPNRQAMDEAMPGLLERYRQGPERLLLLLVDLDDFQAVNDAVGYYGGDELLRSCALLISQRLPVGTTRLYHFGGDKFAILIPASTPAQGDELARAIGRRIAGQLTAPGSQHNLSASIGIAAYPTDAGGATELVKFADAALQEAKQEKGGVRFYHQELHERHLQHLQLLREISQAAHHPEQFSVQYQPQYDLRGGGITGVEALVRWQHPERGNVSPAEFIPVAEKSGAIFLLTEHIIRLAIGQLSKARLLGGAVPSVSINISERQLGSELGCERLEQMLEPWARYFPQIILEITETAAMENMDACQQMMRRLCERRIRFSIDDFGTGFSSLLKLKQLPLYELKIDRSFVSGLPHTRDDVAIVRTTILMARELGLALVAEGIETDAQHQFLLEHNCQYGQGYHYARPMPLEALIALCEKRAVGGDLSVVEPHSAPEVR